MRAPFDLACLVLLVACGGQKAASPGTPKLGSDDVVSVVSKQEYPINIASDGATIFWTNHLGGQIVAMSNGSSPKVLAEHQDYPLGIAVDEDHVYWTTLNGGTVMKVAKSGGKPVPVAVGQFGPTGIAVDGANVYWTNTYGGNVMVAAK